MNTARAKPSQRPSHGLRRGHLIRCTQGVAPLLLALACTDADLQVASYPTHAQGQYCTNDAASYDLPIRILLVIDTSKSMEQNDPNDYRAQAAAELVSAFSGNPNVSFAFIEFNTAAREASEGFQRDPAALQAALEQLKKKEGMTNYTGALAVAESVVHNDIALVAAELEALAQSGQSGQSGQNDRFLRPWYFVIFLSDGRPRVNGGVIQETSDILWRVSQLVDVPPEAAGLTLHTAFLGDNGDEREASEGRLRQMAEAGGGTYTSFANGEEIDFTFFDFSVRRLFDIKQFLVYNRTAMLTEEALQPDSDGDGIADCDELELGTDPAAADSDGDGCSDGFELAAGLLDQGVCPCTTDGRTDSDQDGLLDCEELYLNYDPKRFDTDGDLFPDWLELRVGLNAADRDDWKEDLDFDGVASGVEVRQGTSPLRADQDMVERYGMDYDITRKTNPVTQQTCFSFQVHNLALVDTLAVGRPKQGINEIVFEFIESPEDAPGEMFTLRRSVVPIDFDRNSPETITVSADSFEVIAEQDLRSEAE